MRIQCVLLPFCHPGVLCGWTKTVLTGFKHLYVSFFRLFFIIQKKRQEKEGKKVKGHWRSREVEAD